MAIGDAIDILLAAAGGSHQPASGVEEVITAIGMSGSTDEIRATNGSAVIGFVNAVNQASEGKPLTGSVDQYNMHAVLTNSLHFTKTDTTDLAYLMGVITNV